MRKIITSSNNIEEFLERIVFDKENLKDLKKALIKAKSGEISINDLGKEILGLRAKILLALKDFIPFQLKQENINNMLTEFNEENPTISQLEHELEERNKLLENIGNRINVIFEKLNNSERISD